MGNPEIIIDHLNVIARQRSIPIEKANDLKVDLLDNYSNIDTEVLKRSLHRVGKREYLMFNNTETGVKVHRLPTFIEYEKEVNSIQYDIDCQANLRELENRALMPENEKLEIRRRIKLGFLRVKYIHNKKIKESDDLYDVILNGKYDNVITKWEQDNEN